MEATTADYYEALRLARTRIPIRFSGSSGYSRSDSIRTIRRPQRRPLPASARGLPDAKRSEERAQYDVRHQAVRQERWRFATSSSACDNDFELEQHVRYMVLEILYSRRRAEQNNPGLAPMELEQLTGRPREHLEFTIWYLNQKKLLSRTDSADLTITADGVDYVEQNSRAALQRLRLTAAKAVAWARRSREEPLGDLYGRRTAMDVQTSEQSGQR